ncbi:UPF0652 protein [Porphyridium purpureum]|uniref:UPF0652 protein n=1 Tax=Porphyridium purpureum TaxID=35688 RepID=A0A5J4YGC0_PORPP|nr:UPF0652 protein [Porphyridium purpureum]KAA8499006.1 UPF0652 protein [Porphyridium purpureum]|eukprot:POR8651..scf294_26
MSKLAQALEEGQEDVGREGMSESGHAGMETWDDAAIQKQAREEEEKRAYLDQVIQRPDWDSEQDVAKVRGALVALLDELRESNSFRQQATQGEAARLGQEDAASKNGAVHAHEVTGAGITESHDDGSNKADDSDDEDDDSDDDMDDEDADIEERARYIPLRLTHSERKLLRLVSAALNVCEYTDNVDVLITKTQRRHRMHAQLREICAVLSGLLVASDFEAGQKVVEAREFSDMQDFYQNAFEVARRHKVSNPERLRSDYGKLMYLLQDAVSAEVNAMLEFNPVTPLRTVYSVLHEAGLGQMLRDPRMRVATMEISPMGKTRPQIQAEIRNKERAIKSLVRSFASSATESVASTVEQCIYSIGDNSSFLLASRQPCDEMIHLLEHLFHPEKMASADPAMMLSIVRGRDGARLTHDHRRQYNYVLQSLRLWREISHRMFKLWYLAEQDLLDPDVPYSLRNTGQGLHRVQGAHRVYREMNSIVTKVQRAMGDAWVGSSVIHLGDHNVPNALTFIDKYAQVPRILNPVLNVIRTLPELCKRDHQVKEYIERSFSGVRQVQTAILRDFFRHAFDGSGADNFMDAGSCIDGRLTSAWNWCSSIEKKSYFPVFLLTGFSGFDGQF